MKDPLRELITDGYYLQTKEKLLETLSQHIASISGIRGPSKDCEAAYKDILEDFAKKRGGKLWFPYLGTGLGNGPFVELLDGSVKYDMICGIGPHFFGHNHPELVSVCLDASLSDLVMQGHLQQNKDSYELCARLSAAAGLPHCFLTTSGVMANENALKLAFQKRHPAKRILAFERCFTGRTLAMSQITDKPAFREGLPTTLLVDYVPFFDIEKPEESTRHSIHVLKNYLRRYPNDYACMIFELVQGEAGFYYGTPEFYRSLMDLLKEHGIPIIVDEVQSYGRTSRLFAFQHFGLEKYVDICTVGKISLVCATLYTEAMAPRPGLLSQTFIASTTAIQCGKKIIDLLQNGAFFGPEGRNLQIFNRFESRLKEIQRRHPEKIHGPFGIGCMIAFTPGDGSQEKATALVHALFREGVIAFIAGSSPTRIRLLPPGGVLKDIDIDRVCEIIDKVIADG